MNVIQKQPNPSGAYSQVYHSLDGLDPTLYYEIIADMDDYYAWNGFIIPIVEYGKIISYVCNTELWEKWRTEHQPPTPESTTEEKLQEQIRAQNATIAMMSSVINDLMSDVEALQA